MVSAGLRCGADSCSPGGFCSTSQSHHLNPLCSQFLPSAVRAHALAPVLASEVKLGCLLTTSGILPEGELKLGLKVEGRELSVRGQVRHAYPEDGVGIQFIAIRKGDREQFMFLLAQFVEREFEKLFEIEACLPRKADGPAGQRVVEPCLSQITLG